MQLACCACRTAMACLAVHAVRIVVPAVRLPRRLPLACRDCCWPAVRAVRILEH